MAFVVHCVTPPDFALLGVLVASSRSLNIQCLSKEDFTILYPSFRQLLHKNRRKAAAPAARTQSPKPARASPAAASPIGTAAAKTDKDDAMKAAAKILFEERKPSSRW